MIQKFTHVTILVKDYERALAFYTEKLGFKVHTDAQFGDERWLTVCPANQPDMEFILAKPSTKEGFNQIGKQGGEMGIGVLQTDDCKAEYELLKARGVEFVGEPKEEPWGVGVTLKDLYGNHFYLNQPS